MYPVAQPGHLISREDDQGLPSGIAHGVIPLARSCHLRNVNTVNVNAEQTADLPFVNGKKYTLGVTPPQEMIDDGKDIEICCHFCGKAYTFSVDELKSIQQKAK